jgi:predicted mannosyl-3-phosphoglycerate phosphatase (HAD superfamily)
MLPWQSRRIPAVIARMQTGLYVAKRFVEAHLNMQQGSRFCKVVDSSVGKGLRIAR